jgi:F-box-like
VADINSIPDELLAAIIQQLPHRERIQAEQINKRWQRVASTQGWADVKSFYTREYMWK